MNDVTPSKMTVPRCCKPSGTAHKKMKNKNKQWLQCIVGSKQNAKASCSINRTFSLLSGIDRTLVTKITFLSSVVEGAYFEEALQLKYQFHKNLFEEKEI